MSVSNPVRSLHEARDATFMPYGGEGVRTEVVETYGSIEVEYAAIRKRAALIDLPHRGTIRVSGADRAEFLNRMVTQELKGLTDYGVRRSFWLNRKGRIDADLRLIALPELLMLDCEILSVRRAIEGLSAYLFAEDVAIEDSSGVMHRLALHGPRAREVLGSIATHAAGDHLATLAPDRACEVEVEGVRVVVDRQDTAGDVGLEMLMPADGAERVYESISGVEGVTAIGWHAYNIARIEAGEPIFAIDFGPTNLPHETGVLRDRVSFTKGCYLGQEVVARMQSLGHPKQVVVGLRIEGACGGDPGDHPATGSAVLSGEKVVGAVSSCTRSPMLGDALIALAPVKWDASKAGTELRVESAGGASLKGVVQEGLAFWRHGGGGGGTTG